jgi:hypothetical protein
LGEVTFVNQETIENNGSSDVRIVIGRMTEELQALIQQRDEVVRKICTVKKTVAGLVTLFGPGEAGAQLPEWLAHRDPRRSGLSDECRLVLMNAERPLAVREVRDRVVRRLPSLASHRDSLASVTTILNRLIRYGEACRVMDTSGRQRWAWATEKPNGTGAEASTGEISSSASAEM